MPKIRVKSSLDVSGSLGVSGSVIVTGSLDSQRILINGQELRVITNVSTLTNDAHYQSDVQVSQSIAAAVAGFITEEEDPTVFEYIKEITQQDIASWTNEAAWGQANSASVQGDLTTAELSTIFGE